MYNLFLRFLRRLKYKYIITVLITASSIVFIAKSFALDNKQKKIQIVFLGDSLTEGYGIDKNLAYPRLVEEKLKNHIKTLINPIDIQILNAGISGATSASGTSRLKWFLKNKPTHLFLALGANDGLRGVSPTATKKNLKDIISIAKAHQLQVLVAGMKMPPNYGLKFIKEFERIFVQIAKEEKIPLLPFLLKDVATVNALNQTDGIHPNEKGHIVMAENVFQFLIKNISEFKE